MGNDPVQYDFVDLTTQMEGNDCLNHWDVMVAYDTDTINALLQTQAEANKLTEELNILVSVQNPITGGPMNVAVDMTISQFQLAFEAGSDQVSLLCPFTGTWQAQVSGSTKQTFPASIRMNITTTLANVSGTLVNNFTPVVPDPAKNPVGVGYPVSLDPGKATGQGVCFNLTNPSGSQKGMSVTVEQIPGTSGPDLTTVNEIFGSHAIDTYFKNALTTFFIAAVSNSKDTTSSVTLQPTSFCFTFGASDTTKGVKPALCTWIALGDTPGDNNPTFNPVKNSISPLPTGNTATVYFSHATMANKFIVPSLTPNYNNVTCTSKQGTAGMGFTWQFPSQTINIPSYPATVGDPGSGHVDSASFNLNNGTNTLVLGTAILKSPHAGGNKWAGPTLNVNWSYTTTVNITGAGPDTETHTGVVEPTFNLNGTADWLQNDQSALNVLSFSVMYDPNFSAIVVAKQPSGWEKWAEGQTGDVPPSWSNLVVAAPAKTTSISMDYFLTTNLLMPGVHVFNASDVSTQSSTATPSSGISTPRDTFLTGSVVQKASLAAVRTQNLEAHMASFH